MFIGWVLLYVLSRALKECPVVQKLLCAAADGQKFLVSAFVEDVASKPITVIQNWTALLKK